MAFGASAIHTNNSKIGTCPHGLPSGACPICNGMAGGNSTTKRDTPRNVGEMTYNQCAAIGAMLKAQKHAHEQSKLAQQNHLQALLNFQKNLDKAHQKLMDFNFIISKVLPAVIAKPIAFFVNNILINTLNFVKIFPNFVQNITQKFVEISDKLAAIYGELKVAIHDKVSKFIKDFKKKLKFLFFISQSEECDDEEKQVEEAKRTFELKTFIHKLQEKFTNKKEKEIEKDVH
jgi:hypothetical protein